jgi:hypothetical protein
MTGIKIDEEKLQRHIDTYHDLFKVYPYLICSEETMKLLPRKYELYMTTSTISFTIGDGTTKKEEVLKWHEAKILIDNELPLGEFHIG